MSSFFSLSQMSSRATNILNEVTQSSVAAFSVLTLTMVFFAFRHRLPSLKTIIFRVLYYLYAETRLGQVIHNRQLESRRKKGLGPHSLVCEDDVHVSRGQDFSVLPVPFLTDNYAYILVCERTGCTAFVDPADPEAVLHAFFKYKSDREASYERRRKDLEERSEYAGHFQVPLRCCTHGVWGGNTNEYVLAGGTVWDRAFAKPSPPKELELTSILITHKHMDHAGGNATLAATFPGIEIYGGEYDNVSCCTHRVWGGDTITIGALEVDIIASPCHTPGHVLFACRTKTLKGAGALSSTEAFGSDPIDIEAEEGLTTPLGARGMEALTAIGLTLAGFSPFKLQAQEAERARSAEAHGTAADEAELTDFRTPVASRGNINGSAAELDGVEMEKQQRALQSALEEEEREADMIRSTSQTTLAHFRSRQNLDDLASADSEWSTMDGDHLGGGTAIVRERSTGREGMPDEISTIDSLFTGDTIFVGGSGRFFHGTGADMYRSLSQLHALKPEVKIFCGHEYTEENLKFALWCVTSGHAVDVRSKMEWVKSRRYGEGDTSDPAEDVTNVDKSTSSEADAKANARGDGNGNGCGSVTQPPRCAIATTWGEELRHNPFVIAAFASESVVSGVCSRMLSQVDGVDSPSAAACRARLAAISLAKTSDLADRRIALLAALRKAKDDGLHKL